MDDLEALWDLEALEWLEMIERRQRYVPDFRNNDLDELDNVEFRNRYHFDKSTIEAIVRKLGNKLLYATTRNKAMSPTEKVLMAVRFLASGDHQVNVGHLHHISQISAYRAITEVSKRLAELRAEYVYLPRTEAESREISEQFYSQFGFPSVLGAVDCTLIKILNPGGPQAEDFRSSKGFFALKVQTLSDAQLLIRNIVARWPGSAEDATVFDNSYLRARLETDVPKEYHILGDEGYPLRKYLLRPFAKPISDNQRRYNSHHASARNVVERQHALWKRRFGSIGGTLRCRLNNAMAIIVATTVLHNLAISLGDNFVVENLNEDSDKDNEVNTDQTVGGIVKRNDIVNFFS